MDTFLHTGGDLENDSLPYRKPVRLCRSDVMWNAVGIIYGLRIRSADDSRTLAKRGLMRIKTAISSAAYVFFRHLVLLVKRLLFLTQFFHCALRTVVTSSGGLSALAK